MEDRREFHIFYSSLLGGPKEIKVPDDLQIVQETLYVSGNFFNAMIRREILLIKNKPTKCNISKLIF
jgi:hypothetical protein